MIAGSNTKTNDYAFGMAIQGRKYTGSSSYRYGMNGQEKDDEVFDGAYSAEHWEYDSRLGRRWNKDLEVKCHESPYACFANNPIWFIDKDGNDTLVMNRSEVIKSINGSTNEHKAFIYVITFSIIKKGVETKLPGEMLMMSNQKYVQLKKNSIFKLAWKNMADMSHFSKDAKTIRVYGQDDKAIYLHPASWATNLNGCLSICEPENYKVDGDGDVVMSKTTDAINKVFNMYKKFEPDLTGDKFILKTNSEVKEKFEYLPKKIIDKIIDKTPEPELKNK